MPENFEHLFLPKPGRPRLHFAHANGYPPAAYKSFLQELNVRFEVTAMETRPLWPGSRPESLRNWEDLAGDLIEFLDDHGEGWFGVGHSVGGTVTLMAALRRPDLFRAIAILDPPFFSPLRSILWRFVLLAGLESRFHPLIRSASRRKRHFESKEAMYENYRRKSVFRQIGDADLQAYVDSMAVENSAGTIGLRYTPEWEQRIYARAMISDLGTWRRLHTLEVPAIFIRAEHTRAFEPSTVKRLRRILPESEQVELPGATHLFPLECPEESARIILDYFNHNPILRGNGPTTQG